MRALVLTAGLGTRLRPLTYIRAKAAVPVNGVPLARRVTLWLAASGVHDLVLNLHHHPETIAAVMGDGADLGVRLRYSWENPVLGSAGGPRRALPLLMDGGPGRFLIVNGDTLTDVDLAALVATHEEKRALVTLALIPNPAPHKYGGVLVSADGYVTGFTRRGSPVESFHFIGVQVAEPAVFSALEDGVPIESVGFVYPRLMRENPRSVAAFVSTASFSDIGTPLDYLATSLELGRTEGARLVGANATIHESAAIERSALWDHVSVAARTRLTDCVVGDGVTFPEGAVFTRCAIVPAGDRSAGSGERIEHGLLVKSFDD